MNTLLCFEIQRLIRHWSVCLLAVLLVLAGIFCGIRFNLSAGKGIYLNSPYSIGFLTGMLSLSVIFMGMIYSGRILFKDWDSGFDILMFSYPFSRRSYLAGKFLSYFLQTFFSFILLVLGMAIGHQLRSGNEMQPCFHFWHYLYPLLIFGAVNTFLVCSMLFYIAMVFRKKLLVIVGGLLLYVVYMVLLVFSNAPFMSGSLPQSEWAQQLSALADPFGLSAYFYRSASWSVLQRNTSVVSCSGFLLANRMLYSALSAVFLMLAFRQFSFSFTVFTKKKDQFPAEDFPHHLTGEYTSVLPSFGMVSALKSVGSLARIDLTYLFKSVAWVAVTVLLVFYIGMEMYAGIDQGVRIPQQYAGSGLLSAVILKNFYTLALLLVAYFVNDLYWRSSLSGFSVIEKSAFFAKNKIYGHWLSISLLLFFFTAILILEALVFQTVFGYLKIRWTAYAGVILFNTVPLILFSGLVLLINNRISNRFLALGISVVAVGVLTGPVSKMLIPFPVLRIFSDYKGVYSDFNGYGTYARAFAQRLIFGGSLIMILVMVNRWIVTRKIHVRHSIIGMLVLAAGIFSAVSFMQGYIPKDKDEDIRMAVAYEKQYSKYRSIPQPDIAKVRTEIMLYPSSGAYRVHGTYTLINHSRHPISSILVNFHPDLTLESAVLKMQGEAVTISVKTTAVRLKKPLLPGDAAFLDFDIAYQSVAVNGHDPFNAIMSNGSFMRISRYYPAIGYQESYEVTDDDQRRKYGLEKYPGIKKLNAPQVLRKDFIDLDMLVSTEAGQTAVGTGDPVGSFRKNGRTCFEYHAAGIPFRFAVSSAKYCIKEAIHNGILIRILYHPDHGENVHRLMENARLTLDYCSENFGRYPFKSISFAEVSSFTEGFAATAYPSVIFMPENKLFHTRILAGRGQDVISELAGHELSHLWWGNGSVDPDDREGSAMLTETLAMYTEMMLYKKMYGEAQMMEKVKMHKQIYNRGKSLSGDEPLAKVSPDHDYIAYSKGAVAMVKLSELIGEEKVNTALRNFLQLHQYPEKPVSTDLIREFYKVCPDPAVRKKIDRLFMVP